MPPRDTPLVIAVDIGSTNTHAGLVDTDRLACIFRGDVPTRNIDSRFSGLLNKIKKAAGPAAPLPAIIGGGRSGAARSIERLAKAAGVAPIRHLAHHEGLPLTFRYETPRSLGADRIANALHATVRFPRRNVVIISSGTAVTADAVTGNGEFIGGVIMAGAELQLRGLAAATTSLPRLGLPRNKPTFPGTSTQSCMHAGTIHGIAGALAHFVKRYRTLLGGKCIVCATGGGWDAMEAVVDFSSVTIPDMTLIGTALYGRW